MLEDCAYSRLMRHYYKTEQPLPADSKRLYTICGATSAAEKKAVDTVIREFFRLENDAHHNKRCDLVIAQYQEAAELARQNGKRGGRPPKQKPETNRPGFDPETDPVTGPVSSGLAEQNRTATRNERVSKANHKPITNNQENTNTHPYPPKGGNLLAELVEMLPVGRMDARQFHDAFMSAMRDRGWSVAEEHPVPDRGDGRPGRIDIRAERNGVAVGIELDREHPRRKSIVKLHGSGLVGFCVLREPAPGVPNVIPVEEAGQFVADEEPDGESIPVPAQLDTPAFMDSWTNWLKYRRSKRKKVTAAAATIQLKRLAEVGPEIAIQAIEEAIANDYQGLFPDKVKANGQRTTTVAAGPGQRYQHAPGEPDPGAF